MRASADTMQIIISGKGGYVSEPYCAVACEIVTALL
ncbi:MAG: hypothetical protein ACJASK_000631, partial [Ilumatobacter sp.]